MRHLRTAARIAALALGVGLLSVPAVALAGSQPKPQGPCSSKGAKTTIVTKDGPQKYRCTEVKPHCWIWVWIYNPETPKHHKSYGPPDCPACHTPKPTPSHPNPSYSHSPKPSHSPSQPPSPTATVTPSATPTTSPTGTPSPTGTTAETPTPAPTTPAAGPGATGGLPVTGPNAWSVGVFGALLTLLGAAVLYLARRRRQA
jgi:LPXTG-motif cell wall-anchored protein